MSTLLQEAERLIENLRVSAMLKAYRDQEEDRTALLTFIAGLVKNSERFQWLRAYDCCNGWKDEEIDRQIAIESAIEEI